MRFSDTTGMRTLALPKEVAHWSLTTLREKLVKIGAKVVSHGRYVTFQLAEVAVPRDLFRKILRLIDDLRPRRAPAETEGIDGKVKMTGEVHVDEEKHGKMALASGLQHTGRSKIRSPDGCGDHSLASKRERRHHSHKLEGYPVYVR